MNFFLSKFKSFLSDEDSDPLIENHCITVMVRFIVWLRGSTLWLDLGLNCLFVYNPPHMISSFCDFVLQLLEVGLVWTQPLFCDVDS